MYINGSVFDNYIILYIMHIISLTMFDNYRQAHLAMEHHHHHRFQSFQRVKLGGFPLPFLSTRGYTHTLSLSLSLSLFLSLSLPTFFCDSWKVLVPSRQDENFEPYIKFKHYWEEEVKKAGSIEKAPPKTSLGFWLISIRFN